MKVLNLLKKQVILSMFLEININVWIVWGNVKDKLIWGTFEEINNKILGVEWGYLLFPLIIWNWGRYNTLALISVVILEKSIFSSYSDILLLSMYFGLYILTTILCFMKKIV